MRWRYARNGRVVEGFICGGSTNARVIVVWSNRDRRPVTGLGGTSFVVFFIDHDTFSLTLTSAHTCILHGANLLVRLRTAHLWTADIRRIRLVVCSTTTRSTSQD